ncbi:hypothetical protein FRX31_008361 [Thalictrum thalictroides]|uniref:Uncharacterized protein n=1 Tax=Thalictrum thalictroides TaxID=46969 RepID=A0A7J6WY98_THATH|nr:hypothetical protein FRX31_008361 [Thalictrum thalictroides]
MTDVKDKLMDQWKREYTLEMEKGPDSERLNMEKGPDSERLMDQWHLNIDITTKQSIHWRWKNLYRMRHACALNTEGQCKESRVDSMLLL